MLVALASLFPLMNWNGMPRLFVHTKDGHSVRDHEGARGQTVVFWPGWTGMGNRFTALLRDSLETQGFTVSEATSIKNLATTNAAIVQLHWAEQVFWISGSSIALIRNTVFTVLAVVVLKLRGKRIYWMVHNLRPHRCTTGERVAARFVSWVYALASTKLLTLSSRTTEIVARALGTGKPVESVRHPRWPMGPSREGSRAQLGYGAGQTIYTYFGEMRPNKGVPDLVKAFRARPPANEKLVLAGSALPDDQVNIRSLVDGDPRITVKLERVPTDHLEALIAASDWIVLPFGDYLHSSSMIDAVSHGAPVITSASPYAAGVAADVGDDWIVTFEGRILPEHLTAERPSTDLDLSQYEHIKVGRQLALVYTDK